MRCSCKCLRFLRGGLFVLLPALFSACIWQSAAAYGPVHASERPPLPDRAAASLPAASNSVTLTVWVSQVVTTQANINFRGDALHFDRAGRPALVYRTVSGDGSTSAVYFARQQDTGWEIEQAGSGAEASPSLAFDAQNRPHISYLQSGVVYHAQRDGSAWSAEAVGTGKGAAGATAIAASGTGAIGLVFSVPAADPAALYYARLDGSDWVVETAITGTQGTYWYTNWFASELDFDYDWQGRPHVGFVNTARGLPRDFAILEHAAYIAGEWRGKSVASDMYITGHALSTADVLGGYVGYSTYGPPCVIPCPRTLKLEVAPIDDSGDVGYPGYSRSGSDLEALAVRGGVIGILHSYNSSDGPALGHDRIITETVESTRLVAGDFESAALALDGQGEPLVMYYAPRRSQLVTLRPVQVAFPYGLHLPLISRIWPGTSAR